MLAERRDARALRAILGPEARIAARHDLQRRRNRHSLVVELEGGARCVLKYYRRAPLVAEEAGRLAAANRLAAVATPRLLGRTRHHLVQDWIPGDPLDRLARRAAPGERLALFERAARVLAEIHAAERAGLALTETCTPARLGERVKRARREIETRGFAGWQALHGSVPPAWRRALQQPRLGALAAELGTRGEGCVLGHGDYHPRHLVRTPEDRLYVVDWIAMSLAAPWIELAHLLRWLAPADHDALTGAYLEHVQRRGALRGVSPARARALAASGLVFDHLIVAKQMVRKLREGALPGHLEAFRASLDALAEG